MIEKDVRMPSESSIDKTIRFQRERLASLSEDAPLWLTEYEKSLGEVAAKAQIEAEARLIQKLIDAPDVMRRAGMYDVTMRRVHDSIFDTQEEMVREIKGMKQAIRLVLSAFEGLHDIELSHDGSMRTEKRLSETKELIEQTRRLVAILEDDRWDVGMRDRIRKEGETHGIE